jgi:hypothetical protein
MTDCPRTGQLFPGASVSFRPHETEHRDRKPRSSFNNELQPSRPPGVRMKRLRASWRTDCYRIISERDGRNLLRGDALVRGRGGQCGCLNDIPKKRVERRDVCATQTPSRDWSARADARDRPAGDRLGHAPRPIVGSDDFVPAMSAAAADEETSRGDFQRDRHIGGATLRAGWRHTREYRAGRHGSMDRGDAC